MLNSSDDVPPCKADKTTPRPALQENNSNQEHGEFRNIAGVMPATPSRSASPEIYREDPPGKVYKFMSLILLPIECKQANIFNLGFSYFRYYNHHITWSFEVDGAGFL